MTTRLKILLFLFISINVLTIIIYYCYCSFPSINTSSLKLNKSINTSLSNINLSIPALICIGAQKSGTTSMDRMIEQIPEIYVSVRPREQHYFDWKCHPNESSLSSYNMALQSYYTHCSIRNYQQILIENFDHRYPHYKRMYTSSTYWNKVYLVEKTPSYMVYPHIANIMVNHLVKTGTKIYVLLRDPAQRFISSLFMYRNKCIHKGTKDCLPTAYLEHFVYGYHQYEENETLNEIINHDKLTKVQIFNSEIQSLYKEFKKDLLSEKEYYYGITNVYSDFMYGSRGMYGRHRPYYTIWNRGCYGPQIISYWLYLKNIKIFDSFKIIQYERLYDDEYFQETMNYLRCYLHSNDVKVTQKYSSYSLWMKSCTNPETSVFWMQFTKYDGIQKKNMTGNEMAHYLLKRMYQSDPTELELLRISYVSCNKVLQSVIDEHYQQIILQGWDWKLWNI